jgi:uncharacterized protein with NAD-binding domain and iron-sulfur cluster
MKRRAMACILLLLAMLAVTASAADPGESTRHFNITFSNGSAYTADNASLFSTLEEAYGQVNWFFGSCPDNVEVIILDDSDMDQLGKQVDSFFAWNQALSAIILRKGMLTNDTQLPVIARHEMTHLAINEILCKKDPAEFQWMEEGICTVVSKEALDDVDVSKYIVSHGFLNTSEIFDAIKSENVTISKNGYMNSYSMVRYIVHRYGLNILINMLESPETSFDKAFRQYTGEDFRSFRTDWENYVAMTASG